MREFHHSQEKTQSVFLLHYTIFDQTISLLKDDKAASTNKNKSTKNSSVLNFIYVTKKNGSSMLTIQELFSWFSEDLTRVGEAALIESIQALTLLSSNLLVKLLWEKSKNPLIKTIDSGTVAALGNTTVEIRLLIHDLNSGVTALFCFVILAKQRLEKEKNIELCYG